MEECLEVNGRQLSVLVDYNLEERERWCNVLLYYMFYVRPFNFRNGFIKLSCILYHHHHKEF